MGCIIKRSTRMTYFYWSFAYFALVSVFFSVISTNIFCITNKNTKFKCILCFFGVCSSNELLSKWFDKCTESRVGSINSFWTSFGSWQFYFFLNRSNHSNYPFIFVYRVLHNFCSSWIIFQIIVWLAKRRLSLSQYYGHSKQKEKCIPNAISLHLNQNSIHAKMSTRIFKYREIIAKNIQTYFSKTFEIL